MLTNRYDIIYSKSLCWYVVKIRVTIKQCKDLKQKWIKKQSKNYYTELITKHWKNTCSMAMMKTKFHSDV